MLIYVMTILFEHISELGKSLEVPIESMTESPLQWTFKGGRKP